MGRQGCFTKQRREAMLPARLVCSLCQAQALLKSCSRKTYTGWSSPRTAAFVMMHFVTFFSSGRSNMMSSITLSMIARRPRAPVFLRIAIRAISRRASGSNSRLTPSGSMSFWYCLTREFLGSVRILTSASSSSSSRATKTGSLPTNSGVRPYLMRS